MSAATLQRCRSCDGQDLVLVLDLGDQPLANSYVAEVGTGDDPRTPLTLWHCAACSLLQLGTVVDPRLMFDDYAYLSSYSSEMVQQMAALSSALVTDLELDANSLVVEVASNDGYLLQHYAAAGIPVLGVEPAARAADIAIGRGVPTRVAYFGAALAQSLVEEGLRADVVHANNVLAHVPDVNDFVAGLAVLLAPGGRAVIETPYALDLVDRNAFDTIYHEHVFVYTVTSLVALFGRHGLMVESVERLDYHGGSLRLVVGRDVAEGSSTRELRELEDRLDVRDRTWLAGLPKAVAEVCERLLVWLHDQRAQGRVVAGYGAAAKGTVLLNRAGIGPDLVAFVVDRNPVKQGRFMPGTHQPVLAVEELTDRAPDACLVLAWNHAQEIRDQLRDYRKAGGRLFVAVPELRELT